MIKDIVCIDGVEVEVYSLNTVIVGSGAAGFNAADSLYALGQKDIAVVTEGVGMGTSRNTGSDKQTYYKLTLSGDAPDSVYDMARTLYGGGCMHGDTALVEAALSAGAFYKLVNIGVPFPHNRYGEFVGYRTDHDMKLRATSAGPLTSRYMTEKLEEQVRLKGIKIFDGYLVIGILVSKADAEGEGRATGLAALDMNRLDRPARGFTLFNCTNIVYATGGPAGMYSRSVYPKSQTGANGIAFEAGAAGANLTESQYGIASLKFRWNLSGTYQQVIPRYVSANPDGSCEEEFLEKYFETPGKMLEAIFLKGYQWPFDPMKISNFGSSLIDLLVYNETEIKGRKVFLDFTRNTGAGSKNGEMDFTLLSSEAYGYLEKSNALYGTPIARLEHMNAPAVELYRRNGIDLTREYLEIGVCAQHNNGGLAGNIWWESNLKHFFPVGEANGSFGVYRPGGTALNSTQVGSLRAAQYISANYSSMPGSAEEFIKTAYGQIRSRLEMVRRLAAGLGGSSNVDELTVEAGKRMTRFGAHIRSHEGVSCAIAGCERDFEDFEANVRLKTVEELPRAFRLRDILITQYVYLRAIKEYIAKGGGSRGSYLICGESGLLPSPVLPGCFRYIPDGGELKNSVCETRLQLGSNCGKMDCSFRWVGTRPIPEADSWFENIWRDYRSGRTIE